MDKKIFEQKSLKNLWTTNIINMIGTRLLNAIVLFLVLFSLLHMTKPALIYNHAGGFRPFGLGYKQKTVVPMWLVAIMLAIACYLAMFALEKYA